MILFFVPEGYDKRFAELGKRNKKNKISHRALAINKLCNFLKEYDYEKKIILVF